MKPPRTHRVTAPSTHSPSRGVSRHNTTMTIGFGLQGMQERASLPDGSFRIVGTPDIGATAITSVPGVECSAP